MEDSFSALPFIYIYIPENKGAVSDEYGKRLHHDISQTVQRYSGKWSPNMLAQYFWNLLRETATGECKQQKKIKWVFDFLFLVVRILYRDTVHYLTVYVIIKNQYITLLLQISFSV
jgi:hypothetical protein